MPSEIRRYTASYVPKLSEYHHFLRALNEVMRIVSERYSQIEAALFFSVLCINFRKFL
jgi:hypothetical protein